MMDMKIACEMGFNSNERCNLPFFFFIIIINVIQWDEQARKGEKKQDENFS